jgi:hypothetical protein
MIFDLPHVVSTSTSTSDPGHVYDHGPRPPRLVTLRAMASLRKIIPVNGRVNMRIICSPESCQGVMVVADNTSTLHSLVK